jgi:hypothetical protein
MEDLQKNREKEKLVEWFERLSAVKRKRPLLRYSCPLAVTLFQLELSRCCLHKPVGPETYG